MHPRPTHRKEVSGGWWLLIPLPMPLGPANSTAMVVVFFEMESWGSSIITYSYVKKLRQIECVFCVTIDHSYSR